MKVPTDYAILDAIYKRYYREFIAFSSTSSYRSSKIYVPIDNRIIAAGLGVDVDIVFGRLYYHLEKKYGYEQADGSKVHFFALSIGIDRHCINFPMLGAVLAGLREERSKSMWAIGVATASLFISAISLILSIVIR